MSKKQLSILVGLVVLVSVSIPSLMSSGRVARSGGDRNAAVQAISARGQIGDSDADTLKITAHEIVGLQQASVETKSQIKSLLATQTDLTKSMQALALQIQNLSRIQTDIQAEKAIKEARAINQTATERGARASPVVQPVPQNFEKQWVINPLQSPADTIKGINIPLGSMFLHVKLLSRLIGRTPKNGQIQDSVPFNAVVASTNNRTGPFHKIPELKGLIIQGSASGDFLLHCVRTEINALSLVDKSGKQFTLQNSDQHKIIGYLTDEYGNPCIRGQLVTSINKALQLEAVTSGLSAYADAWAQGQSQTQLLESTNDIQVLNEVLDADKYALGKSIEAFNESSSSWIQEKLEDTWDAVLVSMETKMIAHISSNVILVPTGIGVHE